MATKNAAQQDRDWPKATKREMKIAFQDQGPEVQAAMADAVRTTKVALNEVIRIHGGAAHGERPLYEDSCLVCKELSEAYDMLSQ